MSRLCHRSWRVATLLEVGHLAVDLVLWAVADGFDILRDRVALGRRDRQPKELA